MNLIIWVTGLCRNIIIILLILVVVFALTVKFHQERDLLQQGLDGVNGEIKKLRKTRYQLVRDMIATFGQYADKDVTDRLSSMIASYPKLKSSRAEAEWERKWSPVMARFIKQVSANVPQMMSTPFSIAKKSFSTNEKNLSAQREILVEIKEDMEVFSSNKFKAFFANMMDGIMSFSKDSHERVLQYEREKTEHEADAEKERKMKEEAKKEQITTLHGSDTGDKDLFISSLDELDGTAPLDREFAEKIAEKPEQLKRRGDMGKAARRNAKKSESVANDDGFESLGEPADSDELVEDNPVRKSEKAPSRRTQPWKRGKGNGA